MQTKHFKDEVIVLKRFPINENDLLITVFSKFNGKTTLKAKGSKKILSKFVGKLEPLTVLSAEIYNSGHSLTLVNGQIIIPAPLAPSLQSFETAQKICRTLIMHLPHEEANQQLFKLLLEIVNDLSTPNYSDHIYIYFCTKFLEISGHLPALNICTNCQQKIDTDAHWGNQDNLICSNCISPDRQHRTISINSLKVMNFINQTHCLNDSYKLKVPISNLNEIKKLTDELIQFLN